MKIIKHINCSAKIP